ncbi:MAG: HEPN domain-containing protein [Deltaproteobacteria bacterium]|nr:HEPN domain-containing protein [Deltaproteobacteria bacterium]
MDQATKLGYIRLRLERARNDLIISRDDLTRSHCRGAVNRAYYAIFHTASAALLWLDILRPCRYGTQAAFTTNWLHSH